MPIVNLGNGESVDLGDNPSQEMLNRVRTVIEKNRPGIVESTARDLVGGFGKAASIIPRTAQMLAGTFGGVDAGMTPEKSGTLMNSQVNSAARGAGELADSMEAYWGKIANKSTNPKYAKAALRGIGGAAAAPVGGVVGLAAGAGGGVGTEVAETVAPGNPLAALAGGLAGGVGVGTGAALLSRARPQSSAVAREAMEGFSEAELRTAQQFKNKMDSQQTPVDLAQALRATTGRDGNLTSIRNSLANRSQGNEVQKVLHEQPATLQREGQMTVAGLPGRPDITPMQAANNVQETATGAINAAKKTRSQLWEDTVKSSQANLGTGGEAIPTSLVKRADEYLSALAQKYPNTSQAQELNTLRGKLSTADGYLEDSAQINRILTEFTTRLKSPDLKTAGMDAGTVKYLGKTVDELRTQLGEGFAPIRQANAAYKTNTEQVINPLRQGPVGTLAQPSGYDPATQARLTPFDNLMNVGTESGAKVSEIRTAVREMAKVDKTAAEDAFRGWVRRGMDKAADTAHLPGEASTNADMAKRIYDNLFKNQSRWQGIKDATAEIATARGQDPKDIIRGLENYRQLTLAATSRPAKMEGLSASDLSELGGNSALANAVRVFSFLPANQVGKAIERSTLGKTFSEFDSILTSPEGADRLIKLGKVPVMSNAAKVMFGTIGAGFGNSPGLQTGNPPE